MINNIYIIGIGLIGGSLALDIKEARPNATIFGIDTKPENLDLALELNHSIQERQVKHLNYSLITLLIECITFKMQGSVALKPAAFCQQSNCDHIDKLIVSSLM